MTVSLVPPPDLRSRAVPGPLTRREYETVVLVVNGLSNDAIAAALGITNRTVQAHIKRAMDKTGTSTRTQLAVYALRSRLVPLGPEPASSSTEQLGEG